MHIKKTLYIDLTKAAAFFLVLLLIVLQSMLEISNGLDYRSRDLGMPSAPHEAPAHAVEAVGGHTSVEAASCDYSQMSKEGRADLLNQMLANVPEPIRTTLLVQLVTYAT
eukprot:7376104-Prymnesium_polylepis.1